MLAIKLKRIGKKHQPSYRVVVTEKRHKIDGRYVEDLGWLNPLQSRFEVNKERAAHWMSVGAQPTDTVHNLFVTAGIISGKKVPVHKQPKQGKTEKSEAPAPSPTPEAAGS